MERTNYVKVPQQALTRQERVHAMLDRVDQMTERDRNRIRIFANKIYGMFECSLEHSAMLMHDVNFDLLEDLSVSLSIGYRGEDRAN